MGKKSQDIRILSLYKQHYFDSYRVSMDNQYSCLGYYDGISIKQIPPADVDNGDKSVDWYASRLFVKKSQACLSRVWSGSVLETKSLDGTFSKLNIGIFRCVTEVNPNTQILTRCLEEKSPYFALAFVQLVDRKDWKNTETEIQRICFWDMLHPYICLTAYHTYDNADLVILAYSNSMLQLENKLNEIQENDNVAYVHSIVGVSERYLEQCSFGKKVLSEWNGCKCFIDDKIACITMNVSTSGRANKLVKLKDAFKSMQKNCKLVEYENITFSNSDGHGNLKIDITNTNVKSLLLMLMKGGILTHDNELFGSLVYNIESSLCWTRKTITDIVNSDPGHNGGLEPKPHSKMFFSERTKYYKERMLDAWEKNEERDEGFFSYYCALTQVCNTLAQYEGFSLARDIFCLLFPAFVMFDKQLEEAVVIAKTSLEVEEKLKDSICEFVNAVNSVVYHTIHTDQIFLMVPGYSGTTFSIPIKLCLIYSWIIQKVIDILNDTDYKYTCLLTPELETRPVTTVINMDGGVSDNKLIRFMSSQRSLYMPRHFIILITHEIAHYVGKDVRNRHLRLQCMSKILAQLLAEGVFPEFYCEDINESEKSEKRRLYKILRKELKEKIEEDCVFPIYNKIQKSENKNHEHATEMTVSLKEICYELLEERGIIHQRIFQIPSSIALEFQEQNMSSIMQELYIIQNQLDYNRRCLMSSHVIIDTCIYELLQVFREVFSDVAAYQILNFDMETFSEVFDVSEGTDHKKKDVQSEVRKIIIAKLIKEKGDNKSAGSLSKMTPEGWPYSLKDKIFTYVWVGQYLEDYAVACSNDIQKQIAKKENLKKRVENFYKLFTSDINSCEDIYGKMVDIIEEYKDEITNKNK